MGTERKVDFKFGRPVPQRARIIISLSSMQSQSGKVVLSENEVEWYHRARYQRADDQSMSLQNRRDAENWEQRFSELIRSNDVAGAVRILDGLSTRHAGTPPQRIKQRAIALLNQQLIQPSDKVAWANTMVEMRSPTAVEMACGLFAQAVAKNPAAVRKWMIKIADDENWEVRESAASLFAEIMRQNFVGTYDFLKQLSMHSSVNVRRAVVVAVKYVGNSRVDEWGRPLLDLLAPLLKDRSEYVRKNLGPFALGDGLLRAYPELTLKYLDRWSRSNDEVVRWNVAMCFSTAEARKHLKRALPILTSLAADQRRFVWRAVAAGLKNHGRRMPKLILPLLRKWLHDPKRKQVAQVALSLVSGSTGTAVTAGG